MTLLQKLTKNRQKTTKNNRKTTIYSEQRKNSNLLITDGTLWYIEGYLLMVCQYFAMKKVYFFVDIKKRVGYKTGEFRINFFAVW